jgi:DNA (cytosine-5)-methyltransferase 1
MRLLDLFCGAGGAAMGYHRAGFDEIVGVDIKPQPRYPFTFVQADALEYVAAHGAEFDAIHASPPCQGYSALRCLPWLRDKEYPMLIEPCREALRVTGRPYVIENVERAPLLNGLTLCGRMFGLPVYRHRTFECSEILLSPGHIQHDEVIGAGRMLNDRRKGTLNSGSAKGAWGKQKIVTVAGGQCRKSEAERALGIDWMLKPELTQAIPPAYTEFIGRQLLGQLAQELLA